MVALLARVTSIAVLVAAAPVVADAAPASAVTAAPFKRNWSPPSYRIKAQVLVDTLLAEHPELIGVTFHGRPEGMTDFTMFAATYHDRIGKVSGPDDALTLTLGRIMVETRYKPTDDPRKVVVLIPLEDKDGNDIATAVFGFRDEVGNVKAASYYVSAAIQLRDSLRPKIASHDDLFAKVN